MHICVVQSFPAAPKMCGPWEQAGRAACGTQCVLSIKSVLNKLRKYCNFAKILDVRGTSFQRKRLTLHSPFSRIETILNSTRVLSNVVDKLVRAGKIVVDAKRYSEFPRHGDNSRLNLSLKRERERDRERERERGRKWKLTRMKRGGACINERRESGLRR